MSYGRDYAETHHSPLEADRSQSNVSRLGLAWSVEVGSEGKIETTPLVFNGVLYGTSTWSAGLRRSTCAPARLKWQWDPGLVVAARIEADGPRPVLRAGQSRRRASMTARVMSACSTAASSRSNARDRRACLGGADDAAGHRLSRSPARRASSKGKVVIGKGGAEYGVRGLRRRRTTPRPASWRGGSTPCPAIRRSRSRDEALGARRQDLERPSGGRSAAAARRGTAIAYDPELNLLYVGTGNGSPWNAHHAQPRRRRQPVSRRRSSRSMPTPASYVWHYQTTPGDNVGLQRGAADDPRRPDDRRHSQRKVIMQAPKNGFFYVLDRSDRQADLRRAVSRSRRGPRASTRQTGRPIETEAARYRYTPVRLSPSPVGAHHWPPMAFQSDDRARCITRARKRAWSFAMEEKFDFKEGQWNLGMRTAAGVRPANATARRAAPDPKAPPMGGFFVAWDPVAQKARWRDSVPVRAAARCRPAGQLIFVGNSAGKLFALDPVSGKTLWEIARWRPAASPRRSPVRAGWQAVHRRDGGDQQGRRSSHSPFRSSS